MIEGILAFLGSVIKPITGMIDNLHTSDEEKLELKNVLTELKNTVTIKVLEYETKLMDSQAKIITAEAQGKSWLQRNWRPSIMVMFGAIIFNNYILYPYLSLFWQSAPMLPVPTELWSLLKIGIGGYVIGRSGEKIVERLRK